MASTKEDKKEDEAVAAPKTGTPKYKTRIPIGELLAHGDPETAHLPKTWKDVLGFPLVLAVIFFISLLTFHYAPHNLSTHKGFKLPQRGQAPVPNHESIPRKQEKVPPPPIVEEKPEVEQQTPPTPAEEEEIVPVTADGVQPETVEDPVPEPVQEPEEDVGGEHDGAPEEETEAAAEEASPEPETEETNKEEL
jgi:hypothetical protein